MRNISQGWKDLDRRDLAEKEGRGCVPDWDQGIGIITQEDARRGETRDRTPEKDNKVNSRHASRTSGGTTHIQSHVHTACDVLNAVFTGQYRLGFC